MLNNSLQTSWRRERMSEKDLEPLAYVFDLLPILARKEIPKFCDDAVAANRMETFLALHVGRCRQCACVVQYLRIKAEEK
jgi:hypothetical protein